MGLGSEDLAILEKLELDIRPVGVKYLVRPPDSAGRLDQRIALCEMLKRAQEGDCFYADVENHACEAGPYILGQREIEPQFVSGQYGAGLGAFKDPRAAARLYHYIPRIAKGVTDYVIFAPLDKLSFDPDVMIFLCSVGQTWLLLRAMSYETGEAWSSRYSAAVGCAWLFAHPYLSGEVNFISSGLGFGMKRRGLFPEDRQFVSIPFDRLPSMLRVLREMPWVPEPFQPNGLEFAKTLRTRLGLDKS